MSTLAEAVHKAATERMTRIVNGYDCPEDKARLLDELYIRVMETHPDGSAASVLTVIAEAQTKIMYPNWKKGGDA